MLEQKHFTEGMDLPTSNHGSRTCDGPIAFTPTTIFEKCVVKANSGGQEGYILKTHHKLSFKEKKMWVTKTEDINNHQERVDIVHKVG